tara:strand:- start:1410 stop:1769 length:360 start_codon:yes stop_codon:yes gene_type:complete
MTTTLIALSEELLEEVICEVLEEPIQDTLSDYDESVIKRAKEFCKELDNIGIDSVDGWQDRMYGVADNDADFLQELLEDTGEEWPLMLVIDWQESWDRNYRFDFNVIEFEGKRWYFHNS